ncbi:helix-turn-helix domain-containing protein [Streptomyces sp. NPDC005407]|uniref:helix-turn-helix transcriptional regulator n=1 Tax=Streptomyces sp. NPDC005407 TaxID=3155340 RepID=UPI0033BB3302
MQKLITIEELSEHLGIPVATIHSWHWASKGPKAIKVGKHLRYRESDVDAWLTSQYTAKSLAGVAHV